MVGSFICLSWPYCAGQAYSHLFTHGLRVSGPLRSDGSCECSHHFAGCQVLSSPPRGGNRLQSLAVVHIDKNRLPCIRWTIQSEQQRCEVAIDKTSIQAALCRVTHQSACKLDSFLSSQVRQSGRSFTILYALPQLIRLHVFEDDTVA